MVLSRPTHEMKVIVDEFRLEEDVEYVALDNITDTYYVTRDASKAKHFGLFTRLLWGKAILNCITTIFGEGFEYEQV